MEKENKEKFLNMVSGYCTLKGLDKEAFLEERKQKYGTGMPLVRGVFEEIKADEETLALAEEINWLASFKTLEIRPINEINEFLMTKLPPRNEEIYQEVLEHIKGDNK